MAEGLMCGPVVWFCMLFWLEHYHLMMTISDNFSKKSKGAIFTYPILCLPIVRTYYEAWLRWTLKRDSRYCRSYGLLKKAIILSKVPILDHHLLDFLRQIMYSVFQLKFCKVQSIYFTINLKFTCQKWSWTPCINANFSYISVRGSEPSPMGDCRK